MTRGVVGWYQYGNICSCTFIIQNLWCITFLVVVYTVYILYIVYTVYIYIFIEQYAKHRKSVQREGTEPTFLQTLETWSLYSETWSLLGNLELTPMNRQVYLLASIPEYIGTRQDNTVKCRFLKTGQLWNFFLHDSESKSIKMVT